MMLPKEQRQEASVAVVRLALFSLGAGMLYMLTWQLLHGKITYSVGELDEVTVTATTVPELVSVYLTFAPPLLGLVILGAAPGLFVRFR